MSIAVFILLGLIAGYVALGLFQSTGNGVVLDSPGPPCCSPHSHALRDTRYRRRDTAI
jgi:hypothetical protein